MFNKCMLVGRLARDPDLKEFSNGGSICKLRLITSRSWKDRDSGEMREKVEGHNVSIYIDALGRRVMGACKKGDILLVEGPIETRVWTVEDGGKRYITEIAIRPNLGTIRRMPSSWAGGGSSSTTTPATSEAPGTGQTSVADVPASTDQDDIFGDGFLSNDMDVIGDDTFSDGDFLASDDDSLFDSDAAF
jgi:single-strand DNA-binding protein